MMIYEGHEDDDEHVDHQACKGDLSHQAPSKDPSTAGDAEV